MRGLTGLGMAIVLLVATGVQAEEWPGWRGPRGDGTSQEKDIPIRWTLTENIQWKKSIPGRGYSSPVIWGERIFLTACLEKSKERVLICLDRKDGKVLWQKAVLSSPLEKKHGLNSYASSTPATDGRHVWATFLQTPEVPVVRQAPKAPTARPAPEVQIACYDLQGNKVWQRSPGKFFSVHGFCSSPVLYKDLVIVNCDQDAQAYIVALDKTTGKERWRADRPNRTRSYCVPILVDVAEKKQLVLSGSKCVASYNPDDGKQIWIIDGPTEQFVASLVYLDDILFLTAGFPEHHIMGIRPDGKGDVTKTHILWRDRRGASYVPSPIAHGGHFFLVSDKGMASCLEAKTGKRKWMKQLGGRHSASPVTAGGFLYFPDDNGIVWVLKAADKFEVVAKNDMQEPCFASPAISHGRLYIRTVDNLYCIGAPKK